MPDSTPPADDQAAAAHEFAINIAQGMTNPRQVLCPDGVEGHPWFLVDSAESIACPWCEVDRLRGGEAWTHGFPDPERDATREALDHRDAARIRASVLSGLLRGMARRATQQRRLRKSRFDALVAAVAAMNKARAIADGQSGLAEAWRQDVYRLNQRLAAVRALADEMDPPKCPEHISFVGKQPDCAACEAWWASSPAREARGMQLRAVLDGPTESPEKARALGPTIGGNSQGSLPATPQRHQLPDQDTASAVDHEDNHADGPVAGCGWCSELAVGPTEAAEPRLRPCKLAASSCADPGCTVCYVPPATRAEAAEPTAFTAAARAVLAEWSRMHPSGYLAMYPAMDTLRTALAGSVPVAPALIGTWADPGFVAHQDHRHPVDGCGYCPEEG